MSSIEPPAIIDSATVVLFAILDDTVEYTGRGYTIVDGATIDPVPCLVIARNLYDDDVLLFLCDRDWKVLGAGGYGTVESARERAERVYSGVQNHWRTFRELREDELKDVEVIRRFFRDDSLPTRGYVGGRGPEDS